MFYFFVDRRVMVADFLTETIRPHLLYFKFFFVRPPVVFSAVPCITCDRDPTAGIYIIEGRNLKTRCGGSPKPTSSTFPQYTSSDHANGNLTPCSCGYIQLLL